MKQIFPINTTKEGLAHTITSHYHKAGGRDFYPDDPQVPHLAILEIEEMEEPKIIQVGNYMDDTGRGFRNPQCGREYSADGIATTLNTCGGGDREPKILIVGSYSPTSACNGKVLDANGICQTLLDHKGAEPAILVPKRTETAKELRRQGIEMFANRELVPREDGCSNTITTVQKDNLLQETCILGYTRDSKGNIQNYHERDVAGTLHTSTGNGGNTDQFVKEMVIGSMQANAMHGSLDCVSPCLTEAMGTGGGQIPMVTIRYRIRKLTERECFRLMGMDDADIDKIDAYRIRKTLKNGKVKDKPIPKSQKYKLAGNSIVVSCLYHIFKGMFIDEKPPLPPRQLNLFDDLWHEN